MKRITCKGCGEEFLPGRRSKTYCSNACKQTAYYHRRKASSGTNNSEGDFVTSKERVTAFRNNVTQYSNTAEAEDFRFASNAVEGSHFINNNPVKPINKQQSMEHYEHSDEAQDFRQEQEVDYSHNTTCQPIKLMGMSVDKAWFHNVLQTLPEDQQRELSQMMLETIEETFPELTEGRIVNLSDHNNNYHSLSNRSEELYRLNAGGDSDVDEDDGDYNNDDEDDDADGNAADEDSDYNMEDDSDDSDDAEEGVDDSEEDDELDMPKSRRGKAGNYLNRFSSPRIRRGLTIWEELSVTIPPFMEDYVTSYAIDAGMLVHPVGAGKGGLVTVHILFHLAHHRRAVCRLLDLVLEAEDGALRKRDFMPGGAFATGEQNSMNPSLFDTSEIDYDCSDTGTHQHSIHHGGYQHHTSSGMKAGNPMYGNSYPFMEMNGSGQYRRA